MLHVFRNHFPSFVRMFMCVCICPRHTGLNILRRHLSVQEYFGIVIMPWDVLYLFAQFGTVILIRLTEMPIDKQTKDNDKNVCLFGKNGNNSTRRVVALLVAKSKVNCGLNVQNRHIFKFINCISGVTTATTTTTAVATITFDIVAVATDISTYLGSHLDDKTTHTHHITYTRCLRPRGDKIVSIYLRAYDVMCARVFTGIMKNEDTKENIN